MRASAVVSTLAALGVAAGLLAACGESGDRPSFSGAGSQTAARESAAGGGIEVEQEAQAVAEESAPSADFDESFGEAGAADPAPDALPAAPNTGAPQDGGGAGDDAATQIPRRVISTGSMTVRVQEVRDASEQVRQIAESMGGFVEQLSVSESEDESRPADPDRTRGHVVIRVPQDRFFDAVDAVRELGDVLDENVGSQDVTQQFVDLEARLRAAEAEEAGLLELLNLAEDVSDILVVRTELANVRTRIEQLQGQINFLERQTALGTLSVSLLPPRGFITEPPSAALTMDSGDVQDARDAVRTLVEDAGGVVTSSSLEEGEDFTQASIRVLVPRDEFESVLAGIERLGEVVHKSVTEEGDSPFGGDVVVEAPEEPDAPIRVNLFGEEGGSTALIAGLAGGLGGGLLLLLLAGGLVWARRRGSV